LVQLQLINMPPKTGTTPGVSRKRQTGGKKDKMSAFVDNPDLEDSKKHAFFAESSKVTTMQQIPMPSIDDWIMSQTNALFITQKKKFEKSQMTAMRVPIHAGYHNLAKIEKFAAPKWWMKDGDKPTEDFFTVVPAETQQQDAARAKTVNEASTRRMKGQTLAYILEVNNNLSTADYISILQYESGAALAQHTDCDGKSSSPNPHSIRDCTNWSGSNAPIGAIAPIGAAQPYPLVQSGCRFNHTHWYNCRQTLTSCSCRYLWPVGLFEDGGLARQHVDGRRFRKLDKHLRHNARPFP
jgi:hypothetical protein